MTNSKPNADVAGPVKVGEFSPVETPIETGVHVTTAKDTAMNHSRRPVETGPTGSMTHADARVTIRDTRP